ncbi:hypothetical protein M9Y10_002944 [Tritrichomonas musculus]|uniref:Uncharacterized protein n=1 Tax=Tritrichomonas musculus TaxID=1915356 RepID=A0ABR2LB71_9EUKA
MFLALIALCISGNLEGGWQIIAVDSDQVKHVKGYLDRNLPHLFPEIANGEYVIASAKMQIVAGMKLKLNIKATSSPLLFQLTLYINPQQKITLEEITRPIGSRPILGGYTWQNPSHFTAKDLSNVVQLIQRKLNLLLQREGEVLVYRTKVEKGLKTHVIFRDSKQNVVSAVTLRSPNGKSEELVSANQIF